MLKEALRLSRRAGDQFWATYLTGNLALHQQNIERHDLAISHLNEMARGVEASRSPQLLSLCLARHAVAELRFGNVTHATELITQAQVTSELITQINLRFFALDAAAERDLLQGHPSASLGDLQASLERSLAAGEGQFVPLICDDIARVLITQDHPGEAIDLLAPIMDSLHIQRIIPYAHRLRETIALATWISGDIPAARREFENLAEDAGSVGNLARVARAQMALGAICRHTGDRRVARSYLELALATFHTLGYRPDVAAALRELAGLAIDSPGWARAAYLHGAADAIDHLDGTCYRIARQGAYDADRQSVCAALGDTAFKEAIKLGTSLALVDAVSYACSPDEARRRTRYGWASLTHTETKIAALVCEGLTNPEIASKLMIGRETVKTHLASIYRKLNIKNRAELAAASARHDTTDVPVE